MSRVAFGVGLIEAVALVLYGASVAVFEGVGETRGVGGAGADLAPAVLIGLFCTFGALVLLVTWMHWRGRRAAVTPYALVQGFALVIGQPLVTEASTRAIGAAVILLALVGLFALFMGRGPRS